jgi:cell division protease FtsH
MVTEFGMTEALGPVHYADETSSGYLGVRGAIRQELSPETAALIDRETRRLVEEAQDRALGLLRTHDRALHEVARELQDKEVINGDRIAEIAADGAGEAGDGAGT